MIFRNKARTYLAIYAKYWIINKSGLDVKFGDTKEKIDSNEKRKQDENQYHWYEKEVDLKHYGENGPTNILYYHDDQIPMHIPGSSERDVYHIICIHNSLSLSQQLKDFSLLKKRISNIIWLYLLLMEDKM